MVAKHTFVSPSEKEKYNETDRETISKREGLLADARNFTRNLPAE
jgi:hypothetical protein